MGFLRWIWARTVGLRRRPIDNRPRDAIPPHTTTTGRRDHWTTFREVTHAFVAEDLVAVAARNSGALLTPMLQRVQPELSRVPGLGMTVHCEHAAFVMK